MCVSEASLRFFGTVPIQKYNHYTDVKRHYLGVNFCDLYSFNRASLLAQMVKRLPAMRETRVQSLGRDDPMEKQMATHSSTLAWKIPWTQEPGGLQPMVSQRVRHN